ncbi:MAG: alkaline phosphatase family protein [Lacunisphaera sp.]|nr:alkaline phosphatase family protein [Lacunisphaera sp.]
MKRYTAAFALLLAGLLIASCWTPASRAAPAELLILISLDGFRWDYLDKYDAPVLKRLAADGVHATRMTPSFPAKTFPNHYTLVTGLRPEHHGIVGNWFYDPVDGAKFDMEQLAPHWWQGGEPVWITAEKQGLRAACFFWPGSETELQGCHATFFKPFVKKLTNPERVDGLLTWLGLPPAERPRLATLYFNTLDDAGHKYGPDAPETGGAVREADAAIGRLLDGLAVRGLREKASLVIVSDHGMSPCGPDQVIFFEDLLTVSQVRIEATGPVGGVRPNPGVDLATLVAGIRAKAPPQLQVYLREEVPDRLHYRASDRIAPIVLVCDDHWNVESKAGWPERARTYNIGSHGWDPATPNMGALFIASGPVFRRGVEIPDVENIHVYHLLCAALGLAPAPNDGDQRLVRAALRR